MTQREAVPRWRGRSNEARLRGAELEVAYVLSLPWTEGFNSEWPADEQWYADEASAMLERLIAEAPAAGTAVKTTPVVIRSDGPAFGLLTRAEGADLLVIGSRGLGGFKGLLLGSVGTHCVHHAHCPVVVVPTPGER